MSVEEERAELGEGLFVHGDIVTLLVLPGEALGPRSCNQSVGSSTSSANLLNPLGHLGRVDVVVHPAKICWHEGGEPQARRTYAYT